jgi:TatD DNase family protein
MMVSISTRLDEALPIAEIAATYPQVVYSVGVHPLEAQNYPALAARELLELAKKPKVVALGETGLDFFRKRDHEEIQKQLFSTHIDVARQTGLPVVIHSRGADDETAELLAEEMAKGEFKALIHCFTASKKLAEQVLALGLYISLSGILTFSNAEGIREAVEIMPLDRLLVETDAPYLAPVPVRGKRNEPSYITHTANYLAKLKGVSPQEMIEITGNNFFNLFTEAKKYRQ